MASQRVEVEIVARDLLSPVVSGMVNQFFLLETAVNAAVNTVTSLSGALRQAGQTQTEMLGQAGVLSGMAGIAYTDAIDVVSDGIDRLAKEAANFPGDAEDYIRTANQIAPMLSAAFDLNTASGISEYNKAMDNIAKSANILGLATGVAGNNIGEFFSRAVSGASSLSELRLLDFGTKNPGFLSELRKELEAQQLEVEDWQDLTTAKRVELIENVNSKLVTPDILDAVSNTSSALIDSWMDSIFGIYTGAFGLLRKVESRANRTAESAFANLIKSAASLADTIGGLASRMGLSFDPMEKLIDLFDGLSQMFTSVNMMLAKVNPGNILGGIQLPNLGGLINNALGTLADLDFGSTFASVATGVAIFFNTIIWGLLDTVRTLDWNMIAHGIIDTMAGLWNSIALLFETIDWEAFGKALGVMAVRVANAIATIILQYDWGSILRLFNAVIGAIHKMILGLVLGLLEGLFSSILSDLEDVFSGVLDMFRPVINFIQWIGQGLQSAWSAILDFVRSIPVVGGQIVDRLQQTSSTPAGTSDSTSTSSQSGTMINVPVVPPNNPVGGSNGGQATTPANTPTALPPTSTLNPGSTNNTVSNNFQPTINVAVTDSGADADSIASATLEKLNQAFNSYRNNTLSYA